MGEPQIDLDRLSREQRLHLLERVWESLAHDQDAIPLSETQVAELDRRLDALQSDGPQGIPWEEVLRNIRNQPR